MTLTLDFGTLYGIVERSLSVIGKRSIDDNGNLLFKDITLGSREKAIISDYFTNAFVDLCAELKQYITAEVNSIEGVTSLVYTDFWTNQAASNYTSQITRSGQNLYNYSTDTLYVSSLSFPFSVTSMSTGAVLLYNGTYYKFNGSAAVRMTAEEIAALTPSTPVTVLDYMNTNPSTVTANAADRYAYYNGALYKSSRSASFSQTSIPSGAALVDPRGRVYTRSGNVITEIPSGIDGAVTLTVTMPDNWNQSLQLSLQQALTNYCVSYALHSWFTITAPRIADKYVADMTRSLTAVIRLAHEKTAPTGSADIVSSTSTSVTSN